jgi:EAL domain-containing protein (putative c-di-GMP-specific phosphodiesterase class I)
MKQPTEINIDIVKITSSFIDSLPKSRQESERENSNGLAIKRQRPG